jgi:hypothetical protein
MTLKKGKNKVIIMAAIFIVGSFLFSSFKVEAASRDITIYQKPYNGTLTSAEWNNLINDFISWQGGSTTGPVGIATSTPASGLEVNGLIKATSLH